MIPGVPGMTAAPSSADASPTVPAPAPPWLMRALAAPAPALALAVTVCQVLLAWAASGEADFTKAYPKLAQWDTLCYATVVDGGYAGPVPPTARNSGNFAFFPGYPLSAWLLRTASGLPTRLALVAAAQLACWGFWTYVFLFLRHWQAPVVPSLLGVLLIISRPAAFYLAAGYSEPLFLMSLCGFVYWSGAKTPASGWLAALHGLVMTATRWVGFPLIAYPVVHAWLAAPRGEPWARSLRRLAVPLATAAAAGLGALLYFAYCQLRFGEWDLYMKSNDAGWHTHANYLAILSYTSYKLHWPVWRHGFLDPDWFSRFSVPLYALVLGGFLVLEWRARRAGGGTGLRARAGLYACAVLMFYVSVSAKSDAFMSSMVRLLLPIQALLALALVHHLSTGAAGEAPRRRWVRWPLAAWILLGFVLQLGFAHRFLHGGWVAETPYRPRISRAALRPAAPITPPPGWAAAPHRYRPRTGVR